MKHKGPHRYKRVILGRRGHTVFKCTLPSCTNQVLPEMIIEREVLCNECEVTFVIESKSDLIETLKCKNCRRRPEVNMTEVENVVRRVKDEIR